MEKCLEKLTSKFIHARCYRSVTFACCSVLRQVKYDNSLLQINDDDDALLEQTDDGALML